MESNVSLQPIPKTMEQVIAEFFEVKPEERQLYFRGYRPHNYFKPIDPYRSELYEPQPYRKEV